MAAERPVYIGVRGYFALLLLLPLHVFVVLDDGGLGALQLTIHRVPLLHTPTQLRWKKEKAVAASRAARIYYGMDPRVLCSAPVSESARAF